MSVQIPNGAIVAIATAYAAASNVTTASNAAESVLGVASGTYAAGDYVEFISGWSKATDRIFRVKAFSAGNLTLEGFDTTNTNNFPAGSGGGTIRKINTWQQITQILEWNFGGGDINTGTYQFLENDFETEFTTVSAAQYVDCMLADDVTNTGYLALKGISDIRGTNALRVSLPNGSKLLYQVGVFVNENPSMTKNEIMGIMTRLSIKNKVVRYAS